MVFKLLDLLMYLNHLTASAGEGGVSPLFSIIVMVLVDKVKWNWFKNQQSKLISQKSFSVREDCLWDRTMCWLASSNTLLFSRNVGDNSQSHMEGIILAVRWEELQWISKRNDVQIKKDHLKKENIQSNIDDIHKLSMRINHSVAFFQCILKP